VRCSRAQCGRLEVAEGKHRDGRFARRPDAIRIGSTFTLGGMGGTSAASATRFGPLNPSNSRSTSASITWRRSRYFCMSRSCSASTIAASPCSAVIARSPTRHDRRRRIWPGDRGWRGMSAARSPVTGCTRPAAATTRQEPMNRGMGAILGRSHVDRHCVGSRVMIPGAFGTTRRNARGNRHERQTRPRPAASLDPLRPRRAVERDRSVDYSHAVAHRGVHERLYAQSNSRTSMASAWTVAAWAIAVWGALVGLDQPCCCARRGRSGIRYLDRRHGRSPRSTTSC